MTAELFPADSAPRKPLPVIVETPSATMRARSFGREVLYSETVWIPSLLDKEYFEKMKQSQKGGATV